ncbi:DUF3231 family protein [Neobacillus sp. NRS-1170]|uniref:DUF3231 family protein n=1 Tax=Neobacillus sp. NRS-1170 TaxID=3233898 RepID=UPI003D2A1093
MSRGLLERPPTIVLPEKIEFAEKQSFLTGWFGERRPLNTIEISSLYFNLQKTILTKDLALGFSQTSKSKEIRRFMEEVVKLAAEHIEIFTTILHEDFISSAIARDGKLAEDCANIMISNGWFEEPPSSVDRRELS